MALVFVALTLALHSVNTCASYTQAVNKEAPYKQRVRVFQRAIAECPGERQLYGELASLLLNHQDFSQALLWTDKGLQSFPDDDSLRVQKAEALLPLNKPEEAIAILKPLASGQARFYTGLAYRRLSDHTSARKCFLDAWQAGYRNAYVLYSAIEEDYALDNKPDGLALFQQLLKIYPDSPWVHLLLADAYFAKEQSKAARNEYLAALKTKPDLLEANFRLGYIAFQAGDKDSAAHYFLNEVKLNPGYVDAHLFLAETLLQLDRKNEALVQLQKALTLDPRSELIYKRLGTTLVDVNRLNEAVRVLKKAEQLFPTNAAFPAQLSRVLTLLNQTTEAQKEAQRARQLTVEQHRAQQLSPAK